MSGTAETRLTESTTAVVKAQEALQQAQQDQKAAADEVASLHSALADLERQQAETLAAALSPKEDSPMTDVEALAEAQRQVDTQEKVLVATEAEFPTKYDDMFPYADYPDAYWTGFFSSRANDKEYIRRASHN